MLSELLMRNALFIDVNSLPFTNIVDNKNDNPIVTLPLLVTNILNNIADSIITEKGFKPFFLADDINDCDIDAWYDFEVKITNRDNPEVEFLFYPQNSEQKDLDKKYQIKLDKTEQHVIYKEMDKQIKGYSGNCLFNMLKRI